MNTDKKDFLFNLLASLIFNGINFFTKFLLVRALSVEEYGAYNSVYNFYLALSSVISPAISLVCCRELPQYKKDPQKLSHYIVYISSISFLLCLGSALGIYLLKDRIIYYLFGGNIFLEKKLLLGLGLLASISLDLVWIILTYTEKFKLLMYFRLSYFIQIIILLTFLLYNKTRFSSLHAIAVHICSYSLLLFFIFNKFFRKVFCFNWQWKSFFNNLKKILKNIFALFSLTIFEKWSFVLATSAILRYNHLDEAGRFGAFLIFYQFITFIVFFSVGAFSAKIVNAIQESDFKRALSFIKKQILFAVFSSFTLCLCFLVFHKLAIQLILGEKFINSNSLSLLLAMTICSCIDNVINTISTILKLSPVTFFRQILSTLSSILIFGPSLIICIYNHRVDAVHMVLIITISNLFGFLVYIISYRKLLLSKTWLTLS